MGNAYSPDPVLKFFDDNGKPLVSGFLCTYLAGTNTPVATYDSDGKPNAVNIRLNGRGETDGAVLLEAEKAYKFVLLRADGSEVWTRNNVTAPGGSASYMADIAVESPVTKKTYGRTVLIGFDSTNFDRALSAEEQARKDADAEIAASVVPQVNSDWAETDPAKKSFIENKIVSISDAEIEALED